MRYILKALWKAQMNIVLMLDKVGDWDTKIFFNKSCFLFVYYFPNKWTWSKSMSDY